MRRAGPDRPRRSLPLSPLRPGSPSRSASEPLGKQRAESCPGPRRSFSHPAGGMGLETEPLFQAWSYFRRRKFRQCSELCSQLLEGAPGEQVGGRAGPGRSAEGRGSLPVAAAGETRCDLPLENRWWAALPPSEGPPPEPVCDRLRRGRGTSISAGRGSASRRAAQFSPQATGGGDAVSDVPRSMPSRSQQGVGL